ncbi:hypothetical protein LOK49_LG10G02982 [Camellia lanceoleosa]|uniref:Uncharacterized protein n=1 Tax=Camellia lanceoleosa TaxID=1840588 RepID=A0ACC0GCI9_9ERIC|nr:hypothetical protein LOK49_LG10G02982 [Camellia lanceoleosa]
MVAPSHPKTFHSLNAFSMKSPLSSSSPSTLSSMKLKTLIHTLIFSHMCRIARALSKAKSILIQILKDIQLIQFIDPLKKNNKNKNKLFFGSFRLHYNWCSSHVVPVPSPVLDGLSKSHAYYDSTWNSIIATEYDGVAESQLSGYLHWLEEKVHEKSSGGDHMNEIDKLADMFIANSHEKFMLEKQESYRRFQEMMARSV